MSASNMSCECKRISSNRKCNNCVRSGVKCERDFHNERKWQNLERDRMRLAADLEDAERSNDEALARLSETSAKLARLRKHKRFLEARNKAMLENDVALLEELDSQVSWPVAETASLDAQLAAVTDDPSLSQMMNSPSFWENFDSAVAGGIPSPTGGNQSSSQ
ncbi:uncharacterized protein ACHE_80550S [Aspergillus chevalieri]|nr:uncharacterized protein ACHE_80550S [Aspergillus chevalieri]BCR92650.1 hypothetical protein ACHE_80550S [Aspergillus chevalieri]